MAEGKRRTPRPNLNRCAGCDEKWEPLLRIEGMKGTFCRTCEEIMKMKLKRGQICVHLRNPRTCGKKVCVIRQVMES